MRIKQKTSFVRIFGRKSSVFLLLGILLASVGISLFSPAGNASAAANDYYYTDDSTHNGIQGPNPYVTGDQSPTVTYHKTSSTKNGLYVAENAPIAGNSGSYCYPAIQTSDKKYDGNASGKVYLDCGYPDGVDLQNGKGSINIGKSSDNSFQSGQAQQECQGKTDQALNACQDGYVGGANGKTEDQACQAYSGANLSECQSAWSDGSATQGDGADTPQCETSGFAFSWFFCQIINGLSGAIHDLYNDFIQPFLETKPIQLSNVQNDPSQTYNIWKNFRLYGDIFLVIALLVIVFGESIGGGLIDAYTAKKVLPRLLVAAILINISIYLVAFAIDITNIIGNGIGELIEQPFKDAGTFQLKIGGGTASFGLGAVTATGLWAIFSGGALLEFLLVFFLIPAFLAMLAVLITIIVRTGLIVFLVLISPVAFALYCLPNTEQYFRKWWDLLFKTLLIYPIIAVIFALANVLSITINSAASTALQQPIAQLLSVIALFVPLFLIPYSFRIAGGMLGRVHELATETGKRAHGGIVGSERDPGSWRNKTRRKLSQRQSELGLDGPALGDNFRAVPGSKKWRENRQTRRGASRVLKGQEFLENDRVAQANKGNDQYLFALASEKHAKQMRDTAAREAAEFTAAGDTNKAMQKEAEVRSWDQAITGARLSPKTPAVRMAAFQQHAATGFQYAAGQEGYNMMSEIAADITGAQLQRDAQGNAIGASGPRAGVFGDAMDNAQYAEKGAGRWEFAGINRGAGYTPVAGWDKANGYAAGSQGKPDSFKAGAEHFLGANLKSGENKDSNVLQATLARNLSSGRVTADSVGDYHSYLLDARSSATGANQKEIDKQVAAIEGINRGPTPDNDRDLDTYTELANRVERNRRERRSTIDPNVYNEENK